MADLDLLRFALALMFVLGLIALAAWGIRRLRLGGAFMVPAHERRLHLVEVVVVDARHKIVLVRRDEVEHVVLLGPGPALPLETGPMPPPPGREDPRP